MAAILAIVERLLSLLMQLLGIAQVIQGQTDNSAVEHLPYAIETIAANATNTVIHPTHGNAALLAAINGLSFELPATPPTPWETQPAPIMDYDQFYFPQVAYEIEDLSTFQQMIDYIAGCAAYLVGFNGLDVPHRTYWRMYIADVRNLRDFTRSPYPGPSPDWINTTGEYPPDPDFSTYVPGDTLLTLLLRQSGSWNFDHYGPCQVDDFHSVWAYTSSYGGRWYRCTMTEEAFSAMHPVSAGEPIWPGIAHVTLGTPVPIADTFASAEVCHGVLVAITTWPTKYASYDWGDLPQYPRAGYLSFASDNADQTEVRSFTFGNECIMVKGMTEAAGFLGRAKVGVEGAVTPFLINAS